MSTFMYVIVLTLCGYALSAPFSGIARNVKSDLVLLNRLHRGSKGNVGGSSGPSFERSLPIGEALDLFYRYGFFSLSVRVVPRSDPGAWLVREPTNTVFDSPQVRTIQEANRFADNFQIYFCDDESELVEAYLRDFTADGIEEPHKLYSGSWHPTTKSKYFGLNKDVFDGDSSFVLVKLPKRRATYTTGNGLRLRPEVTTAMQRIRAGDRDSVLGFVHDFGSHFIQSMTVGDVIYQVYALNAEQYVDAKRSLSGRGSVSNNDFLNFHAAHLAPWQVRETGKILAASGDRSVGSFLESNLNDAGQFGTYPNIFKLQQDPRLMDTLEQMTDATSAVLALHFSSLSSWLPDLQSRGYYEALLETQSNLWGVNV